MTPDQTPRNLNHAFAPAGRLPGGTDFPQGDALGYGLTGLSARRIKIGYDPSQNMVTSTVEIFPNRDGTIATSRGNKCYIEEETIATTRGSKISIAKEVKTASLIS